VDEIMQISPGFPIELYSQIYSYNIDYSLFKEGIDIKRAIDIVRWTMEKYGDQFRQELEIKKTKLDYQSIEEEIYLYIDILKKSFYK
jgi:uncharacterized membrane protein YcgQ (UPF0703/DUF1980 family)